MTQLIETSDVVQTSAAVSAAIQALIDEIPAGYMEVDCEGRILRVNRAFCRMHEMTGEQLIGQTPWEFMALDEVEKSLDDFHSVIRSGADPHPVSRTMYTAEGECRTYEIHRARIRDTATRITGMRLIYFDVTASQARTEEAQQTLLWLESVLAAIDDAVLVTDALGFINRINPAAERLTGWKAAELQGKSIQSACPILQFIPADPGQARARMGLDGPCRGRARILNHDREEITIEINASPILDVEHGYTIGVVHLWRSI
jgi:PAS domain S-box-containing protein